MKSKRTINFQVLAVAGLLVAGIVAVALPRVGDAAEPASKIAGWAVVNPTGTLHAHRHVTANYRDSPGDYRIVFDRKVHRCTYSANLRELLGHIIATPTPGQSKSVTIWIRDREGAGVDTFFDLHVICG